MTPSQFDLTVWTVHHLPKWAKTAKHTPTLLPALHLAINYRAKLRTGGCEPSNACVVLRMVRNRGEPLLDYMKDCVVRYARVQPERAHTYRRWVRRAERRLALAVT